MNMDYKFTVFEYVTYNEKFIDEFTEFYHVKDNVLQEIIIKNYKVSVRRESNKFMQINIRDMNGGSIKNKDIRDILTKFSLYDEGYPSFLGVFYIDRKILNVNNIKRNKETGLYECPFGFGPHMSWFDRITPVEDILYGMFCDDLYEKEKEMLRKIIYERVISEYGEE